MTTSPTTALIVGCGYLGRRLAVPLVERGQVVYGTTRSPDKARQLVALGVRPMLMHITQPVTLAALTPALEAETLDVYYLIPPGRPGGSPSPRQVVLGGIAHMVKALRRAKGVRRAVLVSSSAVYGQQAGQLVDADTPAKPVNERGRLLFEGEKLWLNEGPAYGVVRLAGLYGPGRVIGLKAVHEGAPLIGDPQAMLNLIHVDDAAELLQAMVARHASGSEAAGRIELGCDGHPVTRQVYYEHLAGLLDVAPPRVLDDATAAKQLGLNLERLRRSSSKRLDNIVTCQRTGWTPRFVNFREGVADALERSGGGLAT